MSIQGLKRFTILAALFALTTGCASVPLAQETNKPPASEGEDEYEGWLFKSLTGDRSSPASSQASERTSGVMPASATESPGGISAVVPATGSAAYPIPPKKEDDGFQLDDLAPENLFKTAKVMTGYGPNEQVAGALMKEGELLFAEKKYSEAAKRFKGAASRWPDSAIEESAMFSEGECYFFSDNYPKAQDVYENTLKKYDNSRHLDTICKRLFAIGQYWEKVQEKSPHWPITPNLTDGTRPRFDTFGNAIKAYETIRMHDPIGPLADDAVMATANAYFRKKRWEDAAYQYNVLRKEYSNSEHQAQALMLGLQAELQMYQGGDYDGEPLKDADEIAKQALTFPGQLGADRQRIEKARREISERQAERDWTMAQYYDKKKCYGAARHYYRDIVKEYPGSSFAKRADGRLVEIRDKPAEPPNRFKWLTDFFPTKD